MSSGCCCGSGGGVSSYGCNQTVKNEKWVTGYKETKAGSVPRVSARFTFSDTAGSWKARWGIGRDNFAIAPGLYCVGEPGEDSHVLVTANYKMTFDRLRRSLAGMDVWILVLDTKGINVWCAAGEGTFGTEELVARINAAGLGSVVANRTLILPQLGAVGIEAHEVKKQTGYSVVYGPVRAKDIRAFIANGLKATREMRNVRFTALDRLVLTPIEAVGAVKPSIIVFGVLFVLNAIGLGHYGIVDLYAYLGAVFAGCVLAPLMLPLLPGRAFSLKGFWFGLIWAIGVNFINGWPGAPAYGWLKAAAYLLILPAVSAYKCMNFTGSSTFTSLSGVEKEMKIALPAMIAAVFSGAVLLLTGDFLLI